MGRILVVDDEEGIRDVLQVLLGGLEHDVDVAPDVEAAQQALSTKPYDLLVTDLRLGIDGDGLDVIRAAKECSPAPEVVVMTAYGTRERAQKAIALGASFYLEKGPHLATDVEVLATQAIRRRQLEEENELLRRTLVADKGMSGIVGRSEIMREVFSLIERVAGLRTTVLIAGESGTGKERIAKALHEASPWSSGPFVPLNCGALPENLVESELFGYVRAAFTGADSDKVGVFESARGGTLFLDEIGELPLQLQPKLLRALQERSIRPLGATREIPIEDVRVVAASNRELEAEVHAGRFREDLYFRLNVIQIELPALRERPEDIPLLVQTIFCVSIQASV